jgi:hypothetical protein
MEVTMKAERRKLASAWASGWLWLALIGIAVLATGAQAAAGQIDFASPENAAETLVRAVKANDRKAVLAVLGPEASDWISSGDAAADRAVVERFVADYAARHAILRKGDRATLTTGNDDHPFAFPLVESGGRWRFDAVAGKEEMLARRIGRNELDAIKVLQAIVDAQFEYASRDRDGDGLVSYARSFGSSAGKHDGLYWPAKGKEGASPLGELVAGAAAEGYRRDQRGLTPYRGYFYRMLEGQGRSAASGEFDYVVKGRAIGGFAVVAWPARYGNSGIMSFIVNQDGRIYQSDLGPDTPARAGKMQRFDPVNGWSLVSAQ